MKRTCTGMNPNASANHCAGAAFSCAFSGCCCDHSKAMTVILDTMIMVSIFVILLTLAVSQLAVSILSVVVLLSLVLLAGAVSKPKEHLDFV